MYKRIFNNIVSIYLRSRYRRVEEMKYRAPELQQAVLSKLLREYKNTKYGKRFKIAQIKNEGQYKSGVPTIEYEDISEHIIDMMAGNSDVLCKGKVEVFAKSSGTTNDKSKYIPMPATMHKRNHVAASWDTMSIVYNEDKDCKIFQEKSTIMGGSLEKLGKADVGDVSAILLNEMHWAGRPFFTPKFSTAVLSDWERKIELMSIECKDENVVMLGGVPTWTLLLLKEILRKSGQANMLDVWKNASYYFHGGVSFEPYRKQFKELFPSKDFKYFEVYNASEGYFAVSDSSDSNGMLLLVNNDIYYEFWRMADWEAGIKKTANLTEVEIGVVYAMVISTSSGLVRYVIGDTVIFTSLAPYRIKVTGRTRQYINVFGEEVMVANTDNAISITATEHNCTIREYTVAPIYMDEGSKGGHHWAIEYETKPKNIQMFGEDLDKNLRKINSDYDAKRFKNIAMGPLKITEVTEGVFHEWLKRRGKYGGQNKIPRLTNNTSIIDELVKLKDEGFS